MDRNTKIFIAGGTGLIGQYLVRHLYDSGYRPYVISRNPVKTETLFGSTAKSLSWEDIINEKHYFSGEYAIINLAGENISAGRWSESFKDLILKSRLNAIEKLLKAIRQSSDNPEAFIQGSAIGYYDNRSGNICTENSPKGHGFLSDVVEKVENLVNENSFLFQRYAIIRTGIVLSKEGGMLKRLLIPFKWYLGGTIGSGQQWRSWIHYYDEVRAIQHILENQESTGIYNLTSPYPVTEKEFSSQLAKVLKKPHFTKIPSAVLRIIYGELAEAIMLNGERVVPEKLLQEKFSFFYPTLDKALFNLLCE